MTTLMDPFSNLIIEEDLFFFFGQLSCNVIAWPYVVHSLLVKAKSKTRSRMVSFTNKTIQTPEA